MNSFDFRTVGVALGAGPGHRSYTIHVGRGVMETAGALLRPFTKNPQVFVVTDRQVWAAQGQRLLAGLSAGGLSCENLALPPGEASKSFAGLEHVTSWLLQKGCERSDLIVAFGGGVIGDLTGLAAGLLKRGVAFAQIPTTLLAQVDSSVGGKTAINTPEGKNLLGLFNQPVIVLADLASLETLPIREQRAGLAEVVKYGLIDQPEFFDFLERAGVGLLSPQSPELAEAVRRSCAAKAAIVSRDETEKGDRALLNLGHTFGHAFERETGFSSALLHGEAVGLGMVLAMRYSARLGHCPLADADRAEALLNTLGLTTRIRQVHGAPFAAERLGEAMAHDKKVVGGRLTLILTRGIGRAFQSPGADLDDIEQFLREEATR
jgi:3-dehydroquinate synthase